MSYVEPQSSSGPSARARWLRLGVLAAVLVAGAWYLYHNWPHSIERFDARFVPLMLLVPIVSLALNGWLSRELILEFNVRLSFVEWFGLATVNALGNYLPIPQAGTVARGVYLKKVHRLPYGAYTATVLVTYVLFVALSGLIGLVGLAVMRAAGQQTHWLMWAGFAGMFATVGLFTPAAALLRPITRFGKIDAGLKHLRQHGLLAKVAFLQAALVALNAAGIWLAYESIGQPVTAGASLMITITTMIAAIFHFTPGAVGVAEGTAGITARLLGQDASLALVVYLIYRLMAIVVVFGLGPLFVMLLGRRTAAAPTPTDVAAEASGNA